MTKRRGVYWLIGWLAVAAGCSSGGVTSVAEQTIPPDAGPGSSSVSTPSGEIGSSPPSTTTTETGDIRWIDYREGVEVGSLDVPLDYSDPSKGTIELALARYSARVPEERIGSLLVNPGGPGFRGTLYGIFADRVFDDAILDRFDIIGWDPRGTGDSEPIDCIDDYDPYFTALDSTPEGDDEYQELIDTASEFAERCESNNPDLVKYAGTNNSARDIDAIRQALGEEQVSYFGFSYGSELGATWATLFPETVRAAVLDGASDPNADAFDATKQQLAGFQASLESFLAQCAEDAVCPFHNDGNTEEAFVELMAELDANPLPVEEDRPPVNRDVALGGVIQAMYDDGLWPGLEQSLAEAQEGDGSGLLELYDSYYQRRPDGTYGNELEAFPTIQCADNPERLTIEESDARAAELTEIAPLLVPEGSVGGYSCVFFPEAVDPRIEITGDGAGPLLVIGTTGDPATPFESTKRMVETLEDGRLVVVDAEQHTGYGEGCTIEVVNEYLIDLDAPEDGAECS